MENRTTETLAQKCEPRQCDHPTLIKECAFGGPTGNFFCTQCECLITPGVQSQTQMQPSQYHSRKHAVVPLRLPAFFV